MEITGPATLSLGSYSFSVEIPGLGMSNVLLIPDVTAEEAAAAEDTVFHSDLGGGVKLWMAEREGRPLYMTVEMDGWVAQLHVGWESPPDINLLRSLADDLTGEVVDGGVVLPAVDARPFRLFLGDPDSENSVQLLVGACHRESIPGSEVIDHPKQGEVIRTDHHASWCPIDDLEVSVSGDDDFVSWTVDTLVIDWSRDGAAQ